MARAERPQEPYVYDSVSQPGMTLSFTGNAVFVGGFVMHAPTGQTLHVGDYTGVEGAEGGASDHATAEVDLDGVADLENRVGEVDITDLATDANGNIVRLALNFRFSPDVPNYSTYGEIRVGEPETVGHILTGHQLVWPQSPVGAPQFFYPEQVHNTGSAPLAVGALSITGVAAADFALTDDTCSNSTVAPGSSCTALVGFSPTAAGDRRAQLSVPAGGTTDVGQLVGSAPAGYTGLTATGFDYPGNNVVQSFPDGPKQQWSAYGSYGNLPGFSFAANELESDIFPGYAIRVSFPTGFKAKVGVYSTTDWDRSDSPGMWVFAGGDACLGELRGLLNIKQLSLDSFGKPVTADIAFTQFCANEPDSRISGEFLWRHPTAQPVLNSAALDAGTKLLAGGRLISRSRVLSLQTDGNLVLRNTAGKALWSTHTAGSGNRNVLSLQTDGNLVLYSAAGKALWTTHTAKTGDRHYLELQSDGNLVLRTVKAAAIWSARTTGP